MLVRIEVVPKAVREHWVQCSNMTWMGYRPITVYSTHKRPNKVFLEAERNLKYLD